MYKILTEEYEDGLFDNYSLTNLMILQKKGRRVKSNENPGLYILLRQKLLEYGLSLNGEFEKNDMKFRCIRMLTDFPIENEPILKQLYGFDNLTVHILLRGYDNFALAFNYNVDTGKCELQRHSWGIVTDRMDFENLREMLEYLKLKNYENAFTEII